MDALYNLSMERAILSAMIFSSNNDDATSIIFGLSSSDFYLPFHRAFFEAACELQKLSKPINEEFVINELMKKGSFNEAAMMDVLSASPITDIVAYQRELIALRQKRDLSTIALDIKKQIGESANSALEIIDDTIKKIERVAELGAITIKRKAIADAKDTEPEFICKEWLPIPRGTTSMIAAPGGTGKTWLVLQLALRIAKEDSKAKIFLWLSEDPEGIVKNRYNAIKDKILSSAHDMQDNQIHISTEDPILLLETQGKTAKLSSRFYAIKRELREYSVIVIDPLLAFFGGDENDNSQARVFMQPFLNWARSENKSIIFLHHSRKGDSTGASKARGAGAIIDAVRCVYDMEKVMSKRNDKLVQDENRLEYRKFTLTKDNYGALKYLNDFVFERVITPKKSARVVEISFNETESYDMPRIA